MPKLLTSIALIIFPSIALAQEDRVELSPTPNILVNLGLGAGVCSWLRADVQLRNNPSRFWSLSAGTGFLYQTYNASLNWKNLEGWQSSSYWLVGAGVVHFSVSMPFLGDFALNLPEAHAGWGYEWLTKAKTRHAVEVRASYPEVASVHYLYGF